MGAARSVKALATVALLVGCLEVTPVSASAAVTTLPTTLYAGQQLVDAGYNDTVGNTLESTGGEFTLAMSSEAVYLHEVTVVGSPPQAGGLETDIWLRDNKNGILLQDDKSTLRMQTDGNLVLRTAAGKVLWASNTVGTGSHNYLTMQTDGNLVMYTSARKAVWASHTTRWWLGQSQKMAPGQVLINRFGDEWNVPAFETLAMQADGNLVFRCGNSVRWQSNTHVAGSYLVMQSDGNLVMYSPTRKAVWATHTEKAGSNSYFDALALRVFASPGARTPVWQVNLPYKPGC